MRIDGRHFRSAAVALGVLGCALLPLACGDGGSDRTAGVQYSTLDYPLSEPGGSTLLTGIRGVDGSTDVYISAIYEGPAPDSAMHGLVYKGTTAGAGTWHALTYPSSSGVTVTSTALYGPNNNAAGGITVVGNYTTAEAGKAPIGLLYQGPLDGSGAWRTIGPPGAVVTIAHSTMGGLVVGNYDTAGVVITGKAFIYDIDRDVYTELVKEGALSLTAYGIWHNGGTSFTIAGGYTDVAMAVAYLVDWDSATQRASNWTTYRFKNQSRPATLLTHFEGITSDGSGGYNLAADALLVQGGPVIGAALAHVRRTRSGAFDKATWTTISYPDSTLTSANTVYQEDVLGIYQPGAGGISSGYVAVVR